MSTSWQWFPETKAAICCYCGFRATYVDEFAGHLEHECNPDRYATIATTQGLHIGRSRGPKHSHIGLDQLVACIHRGPELRQEPCSSCRAGTRIKVFGCAIHRECQLDDRISGVTFCGLCDQRSLRESNLLQGHDIQGRSP